MPAVTLPVGLDLILYRNASTYNSPSWTALTTVVNLKWPFEKTKAEAFARLSAYKRYVRGLKAAPLEFTLLRDQVLTDFSTLLTAYDSDTVIDMAIANGPIATNGTVYFRGDFGVFSFPVDEPLEQASKVDVGMDLYYTQNAPGFTTVGS